MAFCCSAGLAVVSRDHGRRADREGRAQGPPRSRPHRHEERVGTGLGCARRPHRARSPAACHQGRRRRGPPRLLQRLQRPGPAQPARRRAHAGRSGDAAPRPGRRAHRRRARRGRRGDSRSAVSRRFVAATTEKLAELLASDLSVHDAAVLMIDGIMFHECCCVVALLITADGTKIPIGRVGGRHREHDRGQAPAGRPGEPGTCASSGVCSSSSTGARRSPRASSAFSASTPWCNVAPCTSDTTWLTTWIPNSPGASIVSSRAPSTTPTPPGDSSGQGPRRPARARAPDAAASFREGLDDMFTVRRLGASDRLARSLSCTNTIESMISTVRLVSSGVKRWRDPAMVRRWVGTGMIEAQRSFRRIKGYRDMKPLVDAVHTGVARRLSGRRRRSCRTRQV